MRRASLMDHLKHINLTWKTPRLPTFENFKPIEIRVTGLGPIFGWIPPANRSEEAETATPTPLAEAKTTDVVYSEASTTVKPLTKGEKKKLGKTR